MAKDHLLEVKKYQGKRQLEKLSEDLEDSFRTDADFVEEDKNELIIPHMPKNNS